jgi:hypothetical protein
MDEKSTASQLSKMTGSLDDLTPLSQLATHVIGGLSAKVTLPQSAKTHGRFVSHIKLGRSISTLQ